MNKLINKIRETVSNNVGVELLYSKSWFFKRHLQTGKLLHYKKVAKVIYDVFQPQSVVDFGCSIGGLLLFLKLYGTERILGIEGSNAVFDMALVDNIILRDLRQPFTLEQHFDLSVCYEVAEHIGEKYADVLIKDISAPADKILFVVPKETEKGRGHVTFRAREWWIEKFKENNLKLNTTLSDRITERLDINVLNSLVFEKDK